MQQLNGFFSPARLRPDLNCFSNRRDLQAPSLWVCLHGDGQTMVGDTEEQRRRGGGHHGGKRASLKRHTVSSLATVFIKEEPQREQTTVDGDGDGLGRYRGRSGPVTYMEGETWAVRR